MELDFIIIGLILLNTAGLGYLLWRLTTEQGGSAKHEMVVDTSGLIDGRIIDIVRSGFAPMRIVIPQFVVAELQHLADQADAFKRERARFGLDVVRRLQDMRHTEVVIARAAFPGIQHVDDKLVALAKKQGALLYTTDFNLNQVAQIEGVRVLNVNELAQGLRSTHLPGEKAEIKITQIGQDKTQGVGYLDDGTMVVVEQAGNKIGQKVFVEFSRMLQTQAGKMMFAVMRSSTPKVASTVPKQTATRLATPPPIKTPQAYHAVPQRQPKSQPPAQNQPSQPQVIVPAPQAPLNQAAEEALAVLSSSRAQRNGRSNNNRRRKPVKTTANTSADQQPTLPQ